jgi:hypothetical protein
MPSTGARPILPVQPKSNFAMGHAIETRAFERLANMPQSFVGIRFPTETGIYVGSIAKQQAYCRTGLASSAMLLAPKKHKKNDDWYSSAPRPSPMAFLL